MARKTKELALETREKLLESALDVMSEKPFDTVSIDEIAGRVGLSKGAVYWHFKNKKDLLINLIKHICENNGPASSEDPPPNNFGDLRRTFHNKLKNAVMSERVQKTHKLFHRRHEWPEEVYVTAIEIITDLTKRQSINVADVISRCQDRGEVRADFPAYELATLLSAIFHGIFFFQLSEIFGMDFSKYADFLFDAIEKELKNMDNSNLSSNAPARSA